MRDDISTLTERWISAFCEIPPFLDPELMERMLAELEPQPCAARSVEPVVTSVPVDEGGHADADRG